MTGARGLHTDQHGRGAHPATAEERELFVRELEVVIHAFKELLEADADRIAEIASQPTKLTPR